MAKPINIPNTFASATSAIPLSQLDQDFSTLANATNDLATYSNYVADTGAADAFIVNYPANTNTSSLTTGLRLQFKAANANTGASTLNVQVNGGSIGTAAIRLTDGSALPANTIIAGALVDVMYDGTNFQIMNDPSGGQEIITNLTLSGNLTVAGTSTFTGNVTGNVVNTTTSTITNLTSSNVTITGGTISNVTLDNVTVDVETFSNITINGTASFAAGTVSAPAITTTGDTNTGIYFPAADTIAFTEGGVESMRIDSSGNVGIGTSSPSKTGHKALTINGTLPILEFAVADALTGYIYSNASQMTLDNNGAKPITFLTNNTERMRIDSSGNVGIGTSSPAARLHVSGSSATVRIDATNAFNASPTSSLAFVGVYNAGGGLDGFASIVAQKANTTDGDGSANLIFNTNTSTGNLTEKMRVTSAGNVGIGTSSPAARLQVYNTGARSDLFVTSDLSTSATASRICFGSASGTARFTIGLTGTASETAFLGPEGSFPIYFQTNGTERMRIDSSGNVLIGTTNSSSSAGDGTKLHPDGFVGVVANSSRGDTYNYYNSTAAAYRFYVTNAGTIFATSTTISAISDIRLKENIQDIDVGLDKVMALKPRKFDWKAGKGKDKKGDRGWIAQEFEQVFPEMIDTWKDPAPEGEEPYKSVNADLIPVLVKAIQEQQAMIETLKAEVALLKSK